MSPMDGVGLALPVTGEVESATSLQSETSLNNEVDASCMSGSSADASVSLTTSSPLSSLTSLLSRLMLGQTRTLASSSDASSDGTEGNTNNGDSMADVSSGVISNDNGNIAKESGGGGNTVGKNVAAGSAGVTGLMSRNDGVVPVVALSSGVTLAQKRRQIVYMFQLFCLILVGLIVIYYSESAHSKVVLTTTLALTVALTCYFSPKLAYLWFHTTQKCSSFDQALRKADTRNAPVLEMQSEQGENDDLRYGFSCMQGWRRTMEDDHTLQLFDGGGFFGIYDGHSGAGVANFCGQNMYRFVTNTASFAQGNIKKALYDGFMTIDRYLYGMPEGERERSGCTAVVLYVNDDELYCANAGDSRCILCRNGKAFALSVDHKPYLPHEQSRIEKAGGYVIYRRVNGVLALSRAIGDFVFKTNSSMEWEKQVVTSAPDVHMVRLDRDKDEFAVVACDGIWDMMTSQAVADFVKMRLQQRMPLPTIAEKLMMNCLSPNPLGLGCDNMSVAIVQFKRRPQRPVSDSALPASPAALPRHLHAPPPSSTQSATTVTTMTSTPVLARAEAEAAAGAANAAVMSNGGVRAARNSNASRPLSPSAPKGSRAATSSRSTVLTPARLHAAEASFLGMTALGAASPNKKKDIVHTPRAEEWIGGGPSEVGGARSATVSVLADSAVPRTRSPVNEPLSSSGAINAEIPPENSAEKATSGTICEEAGAAISEDKKGCLDREGGAVMGVLGVNGGVSGSGGHHRGDAAVAAGGASLNRNSAVTRAASEQEIAAVDAPGVGGMRDACNDATAEDVRVQDDRVRETACRDDAQPAAHHAPHSNHGISCDSSASNDRTNRKPSSPHTSGTQHEPGRHGRGRVGPSGSAQPRRPSSPQSAAMTRANNNNGGCVGAEWGSVNHVAQAQGGCNTFTGSRTPTTVEGGCVEEVGGVVHARNDSGDASHNLSCGSSPCTTNGPESDRRGQAYRATHARALHTGVNESRDDAAYTPKAGGDAVRTENEMLRDAVHTKLTQTIET